MHSTNELPLWDDDWIVSRRPAREAHDPWKPSGVLVERERTRHGTIEESATIFLVNRECPFRCVMCDLWKYTVTTRVPRGAIPAQIDQALAGLRLPPHVKLYNAGNFFDAQAIPPGDLPRIAASLTPFRSVLVECHPLLVGPRVVNFRDLLTGELQVAMGLETIHPEVLPRLNKRMCLQDFERAARFLVDHHVPVRAFVLLRPPLLDEAEGLDWALRSVEWAQRVGVECCVLIPTRAGNGAMDDLRLQGLFHPPALDSLEAALVSGIGLGRGRVFADLWDVKGDPDQLARLERMNLEQVVPPARGTR